jgi:hypothetical protein
MMVCEFEPQPATDSRSLTHFPEGEILLTNRVTFPFSFERNRVTFPSNVFPPLVLPRWLDDKRNEGLFGSDGLKLNTVTSDVWISIRNIK